MDITQSRNAAPKQSALPASSPHLNRILNRLSVRADMMRKGVFKLNDLPTDTIKLIMSRLEPQDIGLGGTNKAHNALVKKALIGSAIEGFVTKHNLTTPKGNPTNPAFFRSAIREYRYARPISLEMFQELQQTLHVRNGAAQAEAPLFSIEEILTQPYKAAEFTALSGFFDCSREKVRQFQAIATAGGSNKILTHMRENPVAWRRLGPLRVNDTKKALNAGGEAAAFVKNNIDSWLQLTLIKMQCTIDVLRTGGAVAEFVQNHPEAWLGLDEYQMWETKKALNAGGAAAKFVKDHPEEWCGLSKEQMWHTKEALNAGGALAEFIEKNPEAWLGLNSKQMWHTKDNHPEAWLGLNVTKCIRQKKR